MRPRLLALAAALASLFLIAACASTPPATSEPGDGPAASQEEVVEGEPSGDPTDTGGSVTGSFSDKIKYPDGVEVEVIRIKQTKLTDTGSTDESVKVGAPVQVLSIRVTNRSNETIDVSGASGTMSYGPDGEEAPAVFDNGIDSMSGKVLPAKAKTGTYGWAVPVKYLTNVQLEFSFDYDHGTAIFTGSLR